MVAYSILNDIADYVMSIIEKFPLKLSSLVIGLRYAIAVVEGVEGEAAGLCFVDVLDAVYDPMPLQVELNSIRSLLLSPYHLWRIAGLAIANAVSQHLLWNCGRSSAYAIEVAKNSESIIKHLRSKRRVLVVGNMGPLVKALRDAGMQPLIVERSPLLRLHAFTDTAIKFVSEEVEAAIITGATIPNDTLPMVLALLPHAKPRIVVGPTAQVDPQLLFKYGVDIIASTRVTNITLALRIIERGGGRHDLSKAVEDYIVYSSPSEYYHNNFLQRSNSSN